MILSQILFYASNLHEIISSRAPPLWLFMNVFITDLHSEISMKRIEKAIKYSIYIINILFLRQKISKPLDFTFIRCNWTICFANWFFRRYELKFKNLMNKDLLSKYVFKLVFQFKIVDNNWSWSLYEWIERSIRRCLFFFLTIFANDVTHTAMLVDSPEDK